MRDDTMQRVLRAAIQKNPEQQMSLSHASSISDASHLPVSFTGGALQLGIDGQPHSRLEAGVGEVAIGLPEQRPREPEALVVPFPGQRLHRRPTTGIQFQA